MPPGARIRHQLHPHLPAGRVGGSQPGEGAHKAPEGLRICPIYDPQRFVEPRPHLFLADGRYRSALFGRREPLS